MASYEGVEKKQLEQILRDAEAFLRKLNPGPVSTKSLDEWIAQKPFDEIAAASTDSDLARAMEKAGAGKILAPFHRIFQFHALVAASEGGGEALNLYRSLAVARLFEKKTDGDFALAREVDTCILIAYGKRLKDKLDTDESQERLWEYVDHLASRPGLDSWMLAAVPSFLEACGRSDWTIDQYLRGIEYDKHDILRGALSHISGLKKYHGELAVTGNVGRFGVVINGLPTRPEDIKKAVAPVRVNVDKVLAPFYDTSEVGMTGVGSITLDRSLSGLVFQSTRRAAQAVANQLPQLTIVDHRGRRLEPEQDQMLKPSGPKPSP